MANRERGEVEIEIEGKTYVMRPTFNALCEAEDKAGTGISGIASRFSKQQAGVRDVAALIYGGLVGGGVHTFSFEDVGEAIQKKGFGYYVMPAVNLLRNALRGDAPNGEELEEEKRAQVSA